jgi:ribokinase
VQAVDTTAAGDAYIGALAVALAEDRSVADSLGFAAVAAGLAVTRLGAQPSLASREEVGRFIANNPMPTAR